MKKTMKKLQTALDINSELRIGLTLSQLIDEYNLRRNRIENETLDDDIHDAMDKMETELCNKYSKEIVQFFKIGE